MQSGGYRVGSPSSLFSKVNARWHMCMLCWTKCLNVAHAAVQVTFPGTHDDIPDGESPQGEQLLHEKRCQHVCVVSCAAPAVWD